MASRRFPDAGVRYAIYKNGDRAKNAAITYYLDAAGQTPAPVFIERGTDTPDPADQFVDSTTTLDAFGGQVDFRGPTDGTSMLFAQVGSDGPIFEVPCKPQDQIDALESAVADLQPGGDAEAATAADLAAHAADTTSIHGIADTSVLETTTGAQGKADAAQAAAVQRANHTGTQSADTVVDGTTNKAYTAAEKTKLAGVATGATVNSSDATLLSRTNHTGTQAISTVTGLQTALDSKTGVQETVNTVAASGAAQTLPDVTTATVHVITLTANCTLTLPTAAAGKSMTLALKQDGTGSRTVTWPASVKWPSGVAPALSTAAGATDVLSLFCADGTNWLGLLAGNAFA